MKNLMNVFIFFRMVLNCSIGGTFLHATLEEQIDFAGVIVVGYVDKSTNQYGVGEVEIINLTYYRGCGDQSRLKINNFHSNAMCGAGIPKVGERIIVFACGNEKNPDDDFKLNSYVHFSGWTKWSWSAENSVKFQTGV